MHILTTGATGLLGSTLHRTAPADAELFGIHLSERSHSQPLPGEIRIADIRDPVRMEKVFAWAKPDVVIHTAALGSVDFAETHRAVAHAVNVKGTQVVGELSRQCGATFIHISSNAVFDGESPLYSETDPLRPVNYYGQLKVEAEEWVESSGLKYAIVRPILMYGWPYPGGRDNPVTWWLRSLENAEQLKIVDNVYSKPLLATACAEAIWAIIQNDRTGLYHIAGADYLSLYEFALLTARVFGLSRDLVQPVPDTYFSSVLAPRPRDTSYSTEKMERELHLKPVTVLDGLKHMRATRMEHRSRMS